METHTRQEFLNFCNAVPDWHPDSGVPAVIETAVPSIIPTALPPAPLEKSKSLVVFPLVKFGAVLLNTERDYLIKGLLPRLGLVVVWGPPKCGKSFWVMDVALHVALGWPYRDRKTQQASVIYLALEGHGGYAQRIEAFKQHYSVTDAPFYLLRATINLVSKVDQLIKDITAQLGAERPGAIIVDTLNRSLSGSESKDEDMAKYLAAASKIEEQFRCCVVIVHHCGIDASRPRGHTSLTGAVDVQIAIKRANDLDIVATIEFAKDHADGVELYSQLHVVDQVGLDADGDPITSLVVVPADKDATHRPIRARLNARQINALAALDEATLSHGVEPTFETHSSVRRVTTRDAWRDAMLKNGTIKKNDSNPRTTLDRLQDQLTAHHAIGVHHDFVWKAC